MEVGTYNANNMVSLSVVELEPEPVGELDLFGRSRSRNFYVGSGSDLGFVKLFD